MNNNPATANEPTIATTSQLTGTSFMVIMVDLDIPSNSTPHTFLHWVQTDLTPSTAASAVTSGNGSASQAFTLTNTKGTAALVAYTQPNPPAQNPLSHRYTQVLVDTSALSAAALDTIKTAVQTKVGFDVATVLQSAGLTANVIAGNSFNVTNSGTTANGITVSTTTGGSGKKGQKGNATKGGKNRTKTGAGAAAQATGDGKSNGNGNGNGSGDAKATKSGGKKHNNPSSTAAAGAAGLPAATGGASVSNNLTNSGATGKNGTGTVTVSGAGAGGSSRGGSLVGLVVSPMLAALLGAVVYVL